METQSNDYDVFQDRHKDQEPIKGYKLFLVGEDNKYYSLVYDNPMEFKEGEEYIASGDMSVGKNCYCFGTHDDLDILAFAGFEAPIAVGIITIYPPYVLYDDNYRDCCDIGYSSHIKIEKIMSFDEVCKFMEKSAYRSEVLIKQHKLDEEYIKHLIDKHEKDIYFLSRIISLRQITSSENLRSYAEEKRRIRIQRPQTY